MKRAIPVVVLSAAGLVPLWMFQPHEEGALTEVAAPVEQPAATGNGDTTQQGQTSAANRVIKGNLIRTTEGNVQLQVTFEGNKIVEIQAVTAPNTAPTRMALPLLRQSALEAQSSDIDTVSGATATSGGYQQSLQSAIDQAG